MTPNEVQYLLAAPNASAGYAVPGTVYNSNGNYCSTTQLNVEVAANNLFPDLTGVQNAAQMVDYQCLFVYNSDTVSAMTSTSVWMPVSSIISSAVDWAIAADPTGLTNYNTLSQQALLIANPQVAPVGISAWAGPSGDFTGGVNLGVIGPRQVAAFWIRRIATGIAAATAGFTLQTTFNIQ
jgi:hypothetical protein